MAGSKQVLVLHGPNLNMLGTREVGIYGKKDLADINKRLHALGRELNINVESFQSNHEGTLVDKIQDSLNVCHGLIINPAAYTHTSVALRDAILMLDIPVIEVHLSNIYKRESFRQKSLLSDVVTGQISGLGHLGYELALQALAELMGS